MNASLLWMLTAGRGAGKTTLCRSLAARAHLQGWDVAGLLSPAVFEGGRKTGILAENARTGETRLLASSRDQPSFDVPLGDWRFDQTSIDWGNRILESSLPCDLLIVDELGPLELVYRKGWQAALEVLCSNKFQIAVAVIRPELQGLARQVLSFSATITIDRTQTIDQWTHIYWSTIKAVCAPENQLPKAVDRR
jgi:nucleoside-triphosphatase